MTAGTSSLFVVNTDGTGLTQLTFEAADDFLPSWSPDGARMAFVSNRDEHSEVYVMNADGSSPLRLTFDGINEASPSWSPSSNKILFESDRSGPLMIWSMTPAGDSLTPLISGSNPEWSPSGSKFLFKRDGQVYVSTTADGSSVHEITSDSAFHFQPRWSPDESRIAFATTRSGSEEIWTVSATDGGGAIQLTPDAQGESFYPSWTRH